MKPFVLTFLLLGLPSLYAQHDHIEVGIDPLQRNRLAFAGPAYQLSTLLPVGELLNNLSTSFPGGYFTNELTLIVEGNSLDFPTSAWIVVEMISVLGPPSASFSFWDDGATQPTWSRPTSWTSAQETAPSIVVSKTPTSGHIEGRIFTTDQPGLYEVSFRAIDTTGTFQPSAPHVVRFNAIRPPTLSILMENGQARVSFTPRVNLLYDLQRCTSLADGSWETIATEETMTGMGTLLQFTDPQTFPKAFYRLVEFP